MAAEHIKEVEEYEEEESLLFDDAPPVHEDSEGVWLISYADLMTLLMGFFALLTAMSSFDEQKFNSVADEVAEYVGGEIEKPFEDLGESIKAVILEKNLQDQVQVEVKKTGLIITFEGTLLFKSGDFKLREGANILMNELVSVLNEKANDKKFLIEGHTDNMPINRGIIASNWELSSLRANAVARMFESYEFKKTQIMTIGLGETRPLAPNNDDSGNAIVENQSKNRRVLIKVSNQHPTF
jgi:chemotaxis protein MotB